MSRRPDDGTSGADLPKDARAGDHPLAYDPVALCWVSARAGPAGSLVTPLSWKAAPADPTTTPDSDIGFRPWAEADLPLYREMMTDVDLWRYMPELAPLGLSDDDLLALIALSREAAHHKVDAVLHKGNPVGQVRLEFSEGGESAELSYWLGRPARGKGLGPRAVRAYLGRILPELPATRTLFARVHPENAASARLLEACGFSRIDRAASGLGPRGRDTGDWPAFRRTIRT